MTNHSRLLPDRTEEILYHKYCFESRNWMSPRFRWNGPIISAEPVEPTQQDRALSPAFASSLKMSELMLQIMTSLLQYMRSFSIFSDDAKRSEGVHWRGVQGFHKQMPLEAVTYFTLNILTWQTQQLFDPSAEWSLLDCVQTDWNSRINRNASCFSCFHWAHWLSRSMTGQMCQGGIQSHLDTFDNKFSLSSTRDNSDIWTDLLFLCGPQWDINHLLLKVLYVSLQAQ